MWPARATLVGRELEVAARRGRADCDPWSHGHIWKRARWLATCARQDRDLPARQYYYVRNTLLHCPWRWLCSCRPRAPAPPRRPRPAMLLGPCSPPPFAQHGYPSSPSPPPPGPTCNTPLLAFAPQDQPSATIPAMTSSHRRPSRPTHLDSDTAANAPSGLPSQLASAAGPCRAHTASAMPLISLRSKRETART